MPPTSDNLRDFLTNAGRSLEISSAPKASHIVWGRAQTGPVHPLKTGYFAVHFTHTKEDKMRFKLTPKSMLFAALCVCLMGEDLWLKNALASNTGRIVFTSLRDGNAEIYVMNADGKNQKRLTDHPAVDFQPSWSPDGKKIAFTSYRNGGNIQIFVMDSDGQNPTRLTDGVWDVTPDWSPDGQKIAFTGYRDVGVHGEAWNRDIYVMDADGKNRKRLARIAGDNASPAWSPDGQRIAFVNSGWGWGPQIYVMDSNGENSKRLTDDAGGKGSLSWSPDGQSIAFILTSQVYVMDSDGKNPRKLTDGHRDFNFNPTWSPDSEMIAYESWRRNDSVSEIHLMTADGEHIKKLSRPPKRGDRDPDWIIPAALTVSPVGNGITIWGRLKKLAPNLR